MRRSTLTKVPMLVGAAITLVLTSSWSVSATTADATPVVAKQSTATRYRMVDLGTLGGESSFATAMNDKGVVVGRAQASDGEYHGFLWRKGAMVDLGAFSPTDINNKNQVVGTRDDGGGVYLWGRGHLKPVDPRLTYATAINDRGQVVGSAAVEGSPPGRALWSRGALRMLPLNDVSDINNRGVISGGQLVEDGFHASAWSRGNATDLGAEDFNRSNTYRINDKGWVIGWTFSTQQDERGALWRHGKRTDLGTLGGDISRAVAINDRGVILVVAQIPDGYLHPALWRRGVLTDLSGAGLDANGDFVDFNNRSEIAGSIRPETDIAHAVVYRPIR